MPTQLFPRTLTFTGNRGQRTFESHTELVEWVERESERFYPFANASSTRPEPLPEVRNSFGSLQSAKKQALILKDLKPDPTSSEFVHRLSGLWDQLFYFYRTEGFPPSDSAAIHALQPIVMHHPHAALAALDLLREPAQELP